LFRGLGYP